jgi:hypothetical protein
VAAEAAHRQSLSERGMAKLELGTEVGCGGDAIGCFLLGREEGRQPVKGGQWSPVAAGLDRWDCASYGN